MLRCWVIGWVCFIHFYFKNNNNILQASLSLPGSPFTLRRSSKTSQFSWKPGKHGARTTDRQPLVLPYLDIYNLNLPYADDSNAVTPTSDELCNSQNTQNFLPGRRRLSSTSYNSNKFLSGSRRSSFASHYSRQSYASYGDYSFKIKDRHKEPTHFHWNTSVKNRATHPLLPEVVVDKSKSDDNVSAVMSVCQGDKWPRKSTRLNIFIIVHIFYQGAVQNCRHFHV